MSRSSSPDFPTEMAGSPVPSGSSQPRAEDSEPEYEDTPAEDQEEEEQEGEGEGEGEDTQINEGDAPEDEDDDIREVDNPQTGVPAAAGESSNGKASTEREPGKSLLPHARVMKILKVDKNITIVTREAAFLIAIATEEFIRKLTEATCAVAERDGRVTIQQRDMEVVARKAEEFEFLNDLFRWRAIVDKMAPAPPKPVKPKADAKWKGKGKGADDEKKTQSTLGDFAKKDARPDVVVNEDGTMNAGRDSDDDIDEGDL